MAKKQKAAPPWRGLLFCYALGMLYLLFFRSITPYNQVDYFQELQNHANLRPLYTIGNYMLVVSKGPEHPYFVHCLTNLLGNVLLFIPAGLLLPRVYPRLRKFFSFLLCCLVLLLLVEATQLLTLLGSFDVDDIFLNLLGMLLGYGLSLLPGK